MKDSGIPWIGKTPKNWELIKGKYIFTQRNQKDNKINLELLSPTQNYGVIPQKKYEELSGMNAVKLKESTDLHLLKTIHKGDYCISLRSFQGGFEYSEYEGVVSPAYQVFYPIILIDRGYYKYLFKEKTFINKMNSYTMSMRDGKNIAFADFGNTYIPFPPVYEQHQIANYLDTKCARIDSIRKNVEAEIEALKQYKQSVITEAVTKGLDKNVEMKDSGIPWIGKIPKEWVICKVKNVVSQIGSGTTPTSGKVEFYENGTVNWIQSGDLYETNKINETNKKVSESAIKLFPALHIYKAKFIVIAMYGASVGNIAISNIDACVNQACCCIKTNEFNNLKYMFYWLFSCKNDFLKITDGGGQPNISQTKIKNQYYLKPPVEEQHRIADYLDAKCARIDSIIQKKQELLANLDTYKKSLIYEYVTGKKEVPAV